MMPSAESLPWRSRLTALLEHFANVEEPRDVQRISHELDEILLLVVRSTIAARGCCASGLPPPSPAL
jgi:hypothetical protein